MKKISLAALVISTVLSSCSYDEDPTPVVSESVSKDAVDAAGRKSANCQELKFLTGKGKKAWHVTTYFIGGVDYTFLFQECSLDNIQYFDIAGNYVETEGASKCDPNASDIFDEGTYEFSDDYTHMFLNAGHLQVDFTVVELKPNSFKLKYLDPAFGEVEFWLVPVKRNWNLL
jgi:hypothetical protein